MRMLDYVKFQYCPRCGKQNLEPYDSKSFFCSDCRFTYYHSTATTVVGLIEYFDRIIITKRASEPQKGLLAFPGGFVEYEENLEDAIIREIKEELNLVITAPAYLCSHWEKYMYKDVIYFSTVVYYFVSIKNISDSKANDDVDEIILVQPSEFDFNKLAFTSDKVALKKYLGNLSAKNGIDKFEPPTG
jgi:NAD+ diphosphatase